MTPSASLRHTRARLPAPRRRLPVLAVAAVLAVPATAAAQTPAPSAQTPAPSGGVAVGPAAQASTVAAADNGQVAIVTRADALLRRTARFRGKVAAARAGRTVTVERFDPLLGAWTPIASATAGPDGSYLARWRTDRAGVLRIRAVVARRGQASAAGASPEVSVTVYRPAVATWYGPGLYGRQTACGAVMSEVLLGVAHRTLPCGTPVALSYRGRRIVVPVVDRGPFAHGASYDLTAAAAQAVGLSATDRVGVLRAGDPPTASS